MTLVCKLGCCCFWKIWKRKETIIIIKKNYIGKPAQKKIYFLRLLGDHKTVICYYIWTFFFIIVTTLQCLSGLIGTTHRLVQDQLFVYDQHAI